MKRIFSLRAIAVLVLLLAARQAGAQWTQFRGPNGSGVGSGAGYPLEFSSSKNVVWKTAIPDASSSPVVIGGRVFLTTSQGDELVTISLDAKTGKEVWRRQIRRVRTHKIYPANDPASPTPVADEAGVVAFFPDFGLVAYANDGTETWRHPLGPFRNFYGMAASPILADGMVVLVCDQAAGSFVLALERTSGLRTVENRAARANRRVGDADGVQARRAAGATGRAGVDPP